MKYVSIGSKKRSYGKFKEEENFCIWFWKIVKIRCGFYSEEDNFGDDIKISEWKIFEKFL